MEIKWKGIGGVPTSLKGQLPEGVSPPAQTAEKEHGMGSCVIRKN